MRVAVVVSTIGDKCLKEWCGAFEPSMRDYCARCGYELVHLTEPIDHETMRHPSWQKLLVAGLPELAGFDRIVWLDHDIMLSPWAPPIAEQVPHGMIGAVTWQGSYKNDPVMRLAFEATWRHNSAKWVRDLDPHCFADLLEAAGYPRTEDHMNAGVFVCSPVHADEMRRLYVEGLHNERSSLEQSALTDFLCNTHKHLCFPLDRRFNVVWDFEKVAYYPFLDELYPMSTIIMHCIDATLARVYALHFAGGGPGRLWAKNYHQQAHLRVPA